MRPHIVHQFLPKLLAAFLVHHHIAHHGVFMGARRDKNQNRIAIPRFLHAELEESSLCPRQSILLEFSPLNENTNLSGTFPLRLFDRLGYSIVIEPAKKIVRAHLPTAARAASATRPAATAETTEPAATRRPPAAPATPVARNEGAATSGITITAEPTGGAHREQNYDQNEKENE